VDRRFDRRAYDAVRRVTQYGERAALSPTAPLGAFSLSDAWSSIRAALVQDAQDSVFDNWLMRRESAALQWTTCRKDWLPQVGPLEITTELPFLALAS
jgi:hypothetical protein